MATIPETTTQGNFFQETLQGWVNQAQEKSNQVLEYISETTSSWSETISNWKDRAVEWKDTDPLKDVWISVEPKLQKIADFLNARLDWLQSIEWKNHLITVKDKTIDGLKWTGSKTLFVLKNTWLAIEWTAEKLSNLATHIPKAAFNTASYIPGVSIGTALVRGVQNVGHAVLSVTLFPFWNLITGGPKKVVVNFGSDWFSIYARTVRACTEWIPIIGNLMWMYYDLSLLSMTQEERKKYATFGVFWG